MTDLPASGHRRPKEPARIRRALLDTAARLAVEHGLGALTVQAVAEAAGVTKGGLFHHFPSKRALVEAVFADGLDLLDREIDARLAEDPVEHGRFTRAYVDTMFVDWGRGAENPWALLSAATLTDPDLRLQWASWLTRWLDEHRATDATLNLEIVRLAADGAWLAFLLPDAPTVTADPQEVHARLRALTLT